MFGSIWQIIRGVYTRWRSGIDRGNIEHLRVDLRFQLAMVEYAYFGRSGKRVARCLGELKSVLGDEAMLRYLRTLDPDLRTQFVERFQGTRRTTESEAGFTIPERPAAGPAHAPTSPSPSFVKSLPASNVVPIAHATRKSGGSGIGEPVEDESAAKPDTRSVDHND